MDVLISALGLQVTLKSKRAFPSMLKILRWKLTIHEWIKVSIMFHGKRNSSNHISLQKYRGPSWNIFLFGKNAVVYNISWQLSLSHLSFFLKLKLLLNSSVLLFLFV